MVLVASLPALVLLPKMSTGRSLETPDEIPAPNTNSRTMPGVRRVGESPVSAISRSSCGVIQLWGVG